MADRSSGLAAALLAVALLGTACAGSPQPGDGNATVVAMDDDGLHGTLLPASERYQPAPIALADTDGESYSFATDAGNPLTLVFFGYTNCPDICRAVMASLASAAARLDDAQREQVEVVFVTTDPARDDAETLRRYLDGYDPRFRGLTGDLDTVIEVAEPLHIDVTKGEQLASGGYEVDHTTSILGFSDGEVAAVWGQMTSSSQFAEDILTLLDGGAE